MKPTQCPRLFEVEAARDGRLTGAELASFERHMRDCPTCLRETRALERLAEALRSTPDGDATDMLHVRRERTRLLAAFDRALVGPSPRSSARRRLIWSAAAAALVTCVLVLRRARPSAEPVHPSAVVRADGTAVWSDHREGNREVVDLEAGALWVHVDHSRGEEQLLVVLPDGELKDTGTTFTVNAEDGHTTRVAVQEGHVVLRIRGRAAVALGPGDTWTSNHRLAASASASAVSPADTAPAAQLAAAERAAPRPRPSALMASSSASSPSAPASDSSVEFRAAMAALDVGDNHQAATAFALFLEKHPRDPRAEDAAYLRVIALQRTGDGAATKRAAVEYLRRFPGGFRQAEVEPLAQ